MNIRLKTTCRKPVPKRAAVVGGMLILSAIFCHSTFAYEQASSCSTCHGDFDGSTSPKGTVFPSDSKHEMHRANGSMNTDCELCHTSIGDDPFTYSSKGTSNTPGLGCSGCHVGAGLRAHHAANGINCYTGCHSAQTPPAENINPPYYGSVDTEANNACNTSLVSNVNENWSVGDFLGLDNDGDNLYDLADFDCGPAYEISAIAIEGSNVRISWSTVGGRRDMLQATPSLTETFSDVGVALEIPGVGILGTNSLETGFGSESNRFYRIRYAP